jgi:hypothetical protein
MQKKPHTNVHKPIEIPIESRTPRIPIEQQVMTTEGLLILIGLLLGVSISSNWLWLDAVVGAGMLYAGISGKCMVTKIIKEVPYNKT